MLLKYLSENRWRKNKGDFFYCYTFLGRRCGLVKSLKVKGRFCCNPSKDIPLFLYHCHDDEVAPYAHLSIYREKLPNAVIRELESGGHQLGNDLSILAADIK